jgi:hypothetical protein
MKLIDLKNDEIIKTWFKARHMRENTQTSYLIALQLYTDFTGHTPSELLDEAENEQSSTAWLPMRKRSINSRLLDFRESLEERGVTYSTVNSRMKVVCGFYKY